MQQNVFFASLLKSSDENLFDWFLFAISTKIFAEIYLIEIVVELRGITTRKDMRIMVTITFVGLENAK